MVPWPFSLGHGEVPGQGLRAPQCHASLPAHSSSALHAPRVLGPLKYCCPAWPSSPCPSHSAPAVLKLWTLSRGSCCHQVINFSLVLFWWSQNTTHAQVSEGNGRASLFPPSTPWHRGCREEARARPIAPTLPGLQRQQGAGLPLAGITRQLLLVRGESSPYQGPSRSSSLRAARLPTCPREETGASFSELTRVNVVAVSISRHQIYLVASLSLLPKEASSVKLKPRRLIPKHKVI